MTLNNGCIENLKENFKVLRHQEDNAYRCLDYVSLQNQTNQTDREKYKSSSLSRFLSANDALRIKICKWCYHVVDHFDFDREIVSVTLNYLDRFFNTREINKKSFQLYAVTCLYLAIKLYSPKKLKMSTMIFLSQGKFCIDHMEDVEKDILRELSWFVHPPTAIYFVGIFSMLLPHGCCSVELVHDIKELSRFCTEIGVGDSFFISHKQSTIGLAAILNAIDHFKNLIPFSVIQEFTNNVSDVAELDCRSSDVDCCRSRFRETCFQEFDDMRVFTSKSNRVRVVSPVGVDQLETQDTHSVDKGHGSLDQGELIRTHEINLKSGTTQCLNFDNEANSESNLKKISNSGKTIRETSKSYQSRKSCKTTAKTHPRGNTS